MIRLTVIQCNNRTGFHCYCCHGKRNTITNKGVIIDIIPSKFEMQARANQVRNLGKTIAFVPTMGYLHDGHLSLMRLAKNMADTLVVSIFVNPTQFGPGEDLAAYPRNFDRDISLCRNEKVDILFYPDVAEMYTPRFQTFISLDQLPLHLCGISRPVHFRGVATVVTKLFHIVKPHTALFGQKDYQQVRIIRQLVQDLDMDIQIITGPTVREPDGLAMSSRNAYLNAFQRPSALSLYKALCQTQKFLETGLTDAPALIQNAVTLIQSFPDTAIDYIAICDPDTLEDMQTIDRPAVMALAVKVGKTRLIDNMLLSPP
jgi:pantoate--beta-alanine ligase